MELSIAVEFGHGESQVGCRRLDSTSRECMWEGSRKSGAHRLTGVHAPFCEESMVEGTRIIWPRGSKLWMVGNADFSEIQDLNRPALCGPMGKALLAGVRWRVT